MAKERVFTHHNTGTKEQPSWEKWFAKTVYDAVLMSDVDGETKNIKQYVDERLALLIGGAPEVGDTLKELFDLISNNKGLVDALNAAIANKADKAHTHADATATTSGHMSASDKTKLNGIAAAANHYIHPTGDGNLHVPVTGTTNTGTVLAAGTTAGSLSWKALDKAAVGLEKVDNTADASKPVSTAAQAALNNKVDKVTGKVLSTNDYTDAEKTKLAGVAVSANNYIHPVTDGSKHVPANGSNSNGKFLQAGAIAGTYQWAEVSPSAIGAATVIFADTLPTNAPVGALCFLTN